MQARTSLRREDTAKPVAHVTAKGSGRANARRLAGLIHSRHALACGCRDMCATYSFLTPTHSPSLLTLTPHPSLLTLTLTPHSSPHSSASSF